MVATVTDPIESPEDFANDVVASAELLGGGVWSPSVSATPETVSLIRARDAAVSAVTVERRDRDWLLAMADALGTGSGYRVPLVPESEPFRELFAVVRREALAPFAWAIAEAFRCEKDIEIRVGSLTTVVTAADVRRALATKEPDDG